ncbi:MAG: GntR family transcriptional regulator [Undibacterium sp.]|nr:GntR family transcriptional regulator [Undibacterium sp.]
MQTENRQTHSASIFTIAPGSSEPIYKQLMDQVRRLIASGQLGNRDLLPSVREVALALTLNPMTVSKAYNYLEVEGLVQRQRGVGMVVCAKTQALKNSDHRELLLRPTLERAAVEVAQMGMEHKQAIALFKQILGEME